MAHPGITKRIATIVWSVGVAVVLLLLTSAVMLPSTKRARISFEERAAAAQPEERWDFGPATQPDLAISSSKFRIMRFDPMLGQATQGGGEALGEAFAHFAGSKAGVFSFDKSKAIGLDSTSPPVDTPRAPQHIPSTKSNNFDFDAANILWKPENSAHIFGSKSAVFDLSRVRQPATPHASTQPTTVPGHR